MEAEQFHLLRGPIIMNALDFRPTAHSSIILVPLTNILQERQKAISAQIYHQVIRFMITIDLEKVCINLFEPANVRDTLAEVDSIDQ